MQRVRRYPGGEVAMRQQLGPVSSRSYEREADICKAFAHPARLHVLEFLGDQERTVSEIRRELNVSGPNLSQHLRILKAAGVLTAIRRKQHVYCSCTCPEISSLRFAMYEIVTGQVRHQRQWAAAQRRPEAANLSQLVSARDRAGTDQVQRSRQSLDRA